MDYSSVMEHEIADLPTHSASSRDHGVAVPVPVCQWCGDSVVRGCSSAGHTEFRAGLHYWNRECLAPFHPGDRWMVVAHGEY